MFKSVQKVHMVGVGGIGMSGIAEILLDQGFEVRGSDRQLSEITDRLEKLGAKIFKGHAAKNLGDATSSFIHLRSILIIRSLRLRRRRKFR